MTLPAIISEKACPLDFPQNALLLGHLKKYYSNIKDQDDLISIGTIGLIKAVSTFDYEKGTRFATYASRCIENAIRIRLTHSTRFVSILA